MLHLRRDGTLLVRFDTPDGADRLLASLQLGRVDPLWRRVSRSWRWHAVLVDPVGARGMHPRPFIRTGVELVEQDFRMLVERLQANGEPFASRESRGGKFL
mgnify:CR=1 FL=1